MIKQALDFVLRMECPGGDRQNCKSNHADDPGGATNQGIIQTVYDSWRKSKGLVTQSVFDMDDAEVERIYVERYWLAGSCAEMPWPVSLAHFDACVNTGPGRAGELLQQALVRYGKDVKVDGLVGPKTVRATQAVAAESGLKMLFNEMLLQRIWFYNAIIRRHSDRARWLRIWVERCRALQLEAYP